MKKETFFKHHPRRGAVAGRSPKGMGVAIKIDEKDPRWADIYDESESPVEAMRQFKKYFLGIEAQPKQRRKRRTQVEWTIEVEKIKDRKWPRVPA